MEEKNLELNEELKYIFKELNIQILPDEPNYWLIRTESGTFFDTFKNENYVSIGFDKININDIYNKDEKELKEKISELYPECKKPGIILGQLKKFINEVKKGDIIIIPSKNSNKLCVGQAFSDSYQVGNDVKNDEIENDIYTYIKRIDVNWIAEINKNAYDVYIFRLLSSHQGIVSANAYKNFINRMIFPIYYQNGNIHMSFQINKTDEISLIETSNFYEIFCNAIDLYNYLTNSNIEYNGISVKSTVNSPGIIEFFWETPIILAVVVLFFLCCGKISCKFTPTEKNIELSTEGFLKKILDLIKEFHEKNTSDKKMKIEDFKQKSSFVLKSMKANINLNPKKENNIIIINKRVTKKDNGTEDYENQISMFDDEDDNKH